MVALLVEHGVQSAMMIDHQKQRGHHIPQDKPVVRIRMLQCTVRVKYKAGQPTFVYGRNRA